MKITKLQKKIVLSTFGFVLGLRAVRYTYAKYLGEIISNGNYLDLYSLLNIVVFSLGILALIASIFGYVGIIRELILQKKKEIVSERFIRLFANSFWTLIASIFLALVVKVLIWP